MKSKAFFLLIIFLLNTLVGFACAIQTDGGNKGGISVKKAHDHSSHGHTKHTHEKQHNHSDSTSNETKDDGCCKDEVAKFNSLAKNTTPSLKALLKVPIVDRGYFYGSGILAITLVIGHIQAIDCRQRPPTEDIRISIQSFQI